MWSGTQNETPVLALGCTGIHAIEFRESRNIFVCDLDWSRYQSTVSLQDGTVSDPSYR